MLVGHTSKDGQQPAVSQPLPVSNPIMRVDYVVSKGSGRHMSQSKDGNMRWAKGGAWFEGNQNVDLIGCVWCKSDSSGHYVQIKKGYDHLSSGYWAWLLSWWTQGSSALSSCMFHKVYSLIFCKKHLSRTWHRAILLQLTVLSKDGLVMDTCTFCLSKAAQVQLYNPVLSFPSSEKFRINLGCNLPW